MAGTATRWPWRRRVLPAPLAAALGPDELVQAVATCVDGKTLAASRFGLWVIDGESANRIGWQLIAKARLTARVLAITPSRVVGELGDGTDVLVDEPVLEFTLESRTGLTDVVHTRVRRSVAASRHLPFPGSGGWVVLRRVPGTDGLTRQVRLDPGADARVPGFAEAVAATAVELASAKIAD
jgi:hypothetical protein